MIHFMIGFGKLVFGSFVGLMLMFTMLIGFSKLMLAVM